VLERFALASALHHRPERVDLIVWQHALEVQIQLQARQLEDMRQE
jgi:hypothetical protein